MVSGVESSQVSFLAICDAIIQACKAVWYLKRREGSAIKQVRHIGQSEAIRSVDKALQHVVLSFGQ